MMYLAEIFKSDFSLLQSMTDMNQNKVSRKLPSNYEFTLFTSCNIYVKFQKRAVIVIYGLLKAEKADMVQFEN
jgi:hypothetical protein